MWILVSLVSAFLDSVKYLLGKKGATHADPTLVGWAQWFFGFFLFLPFLFLTNNSLPPPAFWAILLFNGALNALASILFWKGLHLSDISLATPLINFTPLFILLIAPLITRELPNFWGFFGVITIVIGAYLLNVNPKNKKILEPLLSLFRNEGSRLVLFCSGIWAITSISDKIGVELSSPVVYLTGMYAITALLLSFIVFRHKRQHLTIGQSLKLLPVGVTSGAAHLTQMYALTLALVSYVIAVKSTNVLFNIA